LLIIAGQKQNKTTSSNQTELEGTALANGPPPDGTAAPYRLFASPTKIGEVFFAHQLLCCISRHTMQALFCRGS